MNAETDALVSVRARARRIFDARPVESLPLLAAFARGEVTDAQALAIASEIHFVVAAFPRFLAALLANDLDPALRDVVVENLYEEQGRMNPRAVHLATYRALLRALGHPDPEAGGEKPSTGVHAYLRAMADACGRAPVAEAAAVLGIVEDHVARASLVIGRWVATRHPGLREAHFGVHEVVDVDHAEELYELAAHYWQRGRTEEVERGLQLGAYLHRRLWDDVARVALQGRAGWDV